MKPSMGLLVSSLALLGLVGCGGSKNNICTGSSCGTKTLSSIAVSAAGASIAVNATDQLTATGTYSDGSTQNLTSSATWTSSSTATATVSTSGLATGVAAGTTNITASSGSVTSTAFQLTVTTPAPTLTSIAVTPASASVNVNATVQFKATGTYSDNSTQDLTSTATWASSQVSVATMSTTTPGLATGVAAGSTSITASSGTVTSNPAATLTVTAPVVARYGYALSEPTTTAGYSSSGLSSYEVNPTSGILTYLGLTLPQISQGAGYYCTQPLNSNNQFEYPDCYIAAERSGKYLYAASCTGSNCGNPSAGDETIDTYQIETGGVLEYVGFSSNVFSVSGGSGLFQLVADPAADIVFGYDNKGIIPFTIDLNTGQPTPGTQQPLTFIYQIVVDPLGRFLYALVYNPNPPQGTSNFGIYAYSIGSGSSSGTLTPVSGMPFTFKSSATSSAPTGVWLNYQVMAEDQTGSFLYELTSDTNDDCDITIWSISGSNSATPGALTQTSNTVPCGSFPYSLAISPQGNELLVVDFNFSTYSGSVMPFAISAGSLTPASITNNVQPDYFPNQTNPISFDPSGNYAFVAGYSGYIEAIQGYSINGQTGALTAVSPNPQITRDETAPAILGGTAAATYTPNSAFVATQQPSGSVTAFTVNAGELNLDTPATFSLGGSAASIAFAPSELVVPGGSDGQVHYLPLSDGVPEGAAGVASQIPAPTWPWTAVVDSDGQYVYVSNAYIAGVESLQVLPGGGLAPTGFTAYNPSVQLNPPTLTTVPSDLAPMVADPSGQYLLLVNYNQVAATPAYVSIFEVTSGTGEVQFLGYCPGNTNNSQNPVGIAVDPLGRVVVAYAAGYVDIFQIPTAPFSSLVPSNCAPATSQSIAADIPTGSQVTGVLTSVAIDPSSENVYFTYAYPGEASEIGGVLGYPIMVGTKGEPTLGKSLTNAAPAPASGQNDLVIVPGFAYVTNYYSFTVTPYSTGSTGLAPLNTHANPTTQQQGPVSITVTGSFK